MSVVNPESGRQIKIGGPKYRELIARGVISDVASPASSALTTPQSKNSGTRKAPMESATKFPVGTERQGSDGLYIIRVRTNGAQYWAKCANKNSNCKTNQTGGNPILSALPTLSNLALPVGLTASSYMANRYLGRTPTKQRGGNYLLQTASNLAVPIGLIAGSYWLEDFLGSSTQVRRNNISNQQGGSLGPLLVQAISDLSVPLGLAMGAKYLSEREGDLILQSGGDLPVIMDPTMSAYMASHGINLLSASTLVPLGILLAVYAAYNYNTTPSRSTIQTGGFHQELSKLVDSKDLKEYQKRNQIKSITPQTQFPFATIMGKDVFHRYVNQN